MKNCCTLHKLNAINKMSKSQKERYAHTLYNNILNDIIQPMEGNKTTYVNQLDKISRKLLTSSKFRGVYPSDKIPKLNGIKRYCILNLDRSDQSGSHWIGMAKCPNTNKTYIYDSFGRHHAKIIKDVMYSGNGRIYSTDPDVEQDVAQTNCGQRTISWLCVFDRWGADIAMLI